ncbi:MAG: YraN family protein [Deltaproteobacteria bacterium]|nr:YraN family protein [Deltaproteobacteria bacterium]
MSNNTKETGKRGEEIAATYLKKEGYRIRERNYRCPVGEIDIIALDGNEVVFVEVKSRRSDDFGEPEAAVDARKQAKLSRIALSYINEHNLNDRNARFDVVAVSFSKGAHHLRLIRNAFDLNC